MDGGPDHLAFSTFMALVVALLEADMIFGVGRSVAGDMATSGLSRTGSGVVNTTAYESNRRNRVFEIGSQPNMWDQKHKPRATKIGSEKEVLYEKSENEMKRKKH